MEVNQLPTKPGPYYWRESDGDKWELGNVFEHYDKRFYFETFNIGGKPVVDLPGQWLPIPTAEELLELLRLVDIIQNEPVGAYADWSKTWGELKQYADKLRQEIGE